MNGLTKKPLSPTIIMNCFKSTSKVPTRSLSVIRKNQVARSGEWKCGICRQLLPASFEIDHIIPVCVLQRDEFLWALCNSCHATKSRLERKNTKRQLGVQKQLDSSPCWKSFKQCLMCDQIVSIYFQHKCEFNEEDLRNRWRRLICPSTSSFF